MKRKWWLLGGVLAATLLSLSIFGVRLRLAPRLILSRALGTALDQLEKRFEDSPVHLFSQAIDPQGRQKADIKLETEQDPLGIVCYDMQLHTQLSPCRVQAEGTVVTGGKALDLALYLDGDFAAVSSQSLVEGSYYGVTYDMFPKDIRSRQLLAALIGDKTISQWEQSVSDLDAAMSWDGKLPEIEVEDIVAALYGVLTLTPQVSRVEIPAGTAPRAYAVTFRASVREIVQAAESYRNEIPTELMILLNKLKQDPNAIVNVQFLLHKGDLVQITAEVDSTVNYTRIFFDMGVDPEISELVVEIFTKAGENDCQTWMALETASDRETYQEKLSILQNRNRVTSKLSLDYTFDLSTGEMDLVILRDKEKARLQLNLKGEGDTITIISQNVTPLLNLFLKKPLERPAICTLTVSPGREVPVPKYRNLDQWSMEDLLGLLTGFGNLLGLKLP